MELTKQVDLANSVTQVDKLDIDKLQTTPVYLSKLSDIVKNKAAGDVYGKLVKKINAIQTVDTSNLISKDNYHTKVSKTEVKVPNSTQKIKELSAENFKERLKKADCVNKTDFCDKQILIKNLLQIKQHI